MRSLCRILLILSASALPAFGVPSPNVLYGNLNATIGSYVPANGSGPLYNSFSTGPTGRLLTDVQVYLDLGDAPTGTTTVALFADSNTRPGNPIRILATINDNSVVSNGGIVDIPVSPAISLAPNTRYWIGMGTANASEIEWASTDTTNGIGNISNEYNCTTVVNLQPGGATNPRSARAHGLSPTLTCVANVNDPFLMQITATPAAAAPALSFSGILVLTLLLAASAAIFLRRSPASAS